MLTTVNQNELCSTCNEVDECIIPRSNTRLPVVYCEQFNDFYPAPPRKQPEIKAVSIPAKDEIEYKGLCVNCEHRGECVHARTEGGVWHCEQYE